MDLRDDQLERYARHIILKEVGGAGQARLLNARVLDAEKLSGDEFPPELALRLKHMIVSHHGSLEFGSPTVPMTLEATALHHLDNLDAKMQSYGQLLREESHSDSRWTAYQSNVGRKLFKGEGY